MNKYVFLLEKYLKCRKEILKRDIDINEDIQSDQPCYDGHGRARLAEVQHIIDTLRCIDSDEIAREVLGDE